MVNRRVDIDVLGVTPDRVAVVRGVQRRAHLVEKAADILLLGVAPGPLDVHLFRVDILDALACRTKTGIAGIAPVDLENVAPRDIRLLFVLLE